MAGAPQFLGFSSDCLQARRRNMDSLTSMRVFCAVVDNGSFAAAAGKLRLSRAMVTKHVMHLENHLSIRLLNRTTRRLSLTEAGAGYYDRCTQILTEVEDAEAQARQSSAEPRGTLRLNAPYSFATAHVAPHLPEFLASHPDLKLDITLNDRFVDLIEEGFDVAVRVAAALPESSLVARKLASCRMVVCGTPEYFQKHGEPRTPSELERHNCLSYSLSATQGSWTFTCADGRKHSVRVSGNIQANSGDTLRAATLSGIGIMLLPTFIVGEQLASGQLRPILLDCQTQESTIYAVYASRRHLSAKVRAFVDFLGHKYGPEPYWDRWRETLGELPATAPREGEALAGA
jgi:DNA-binding transcriptional LysR family regulator